MTRTAVRPGRGPGSPGVPVSGRRASAAGGVGSPGTGPKRGRFAMYSASVRAASSSGVRDWRAASSARSAARSSESLTVMPVAVRLLHRSRSVSARSLCVTAYVGIRNLPCTNCAIFLMTSMNTTAKRCRALPGVPACADRGKYRSDALSRRRREPPGGAQRPRLPARVLVVVQLLGRSPWMMSQCPSTGSAPSGAALRRREWRATSASGRRWRLTAPTPARRRGGTAGSSAESGDRRRAVQNVRRISRPSISRWGGCRWERPPWRCRRHSGDLTGPAGCRVGRGDRVCCPRGVPRAARGPNPAGAGKGRFSVRSGTCSIVRRPLFRRATGRRA